MGGPARYVLLVAALAVAGCGVEARLPAPAGPGPTAATTSLPTTTSTAPPSTSTSTTVPPCNARVASWPLADRLEQVLMVGGEFTDLGPSAASASAGVGALVLFGQPPAGA